MGNLRLQLCDFSFVRGDFVQFSPSCSCPADALCQRVDLFLRTLNAPQIALCLAREPPLLADDLLLRH